MDHVAAVGTVIAWFVLDNHLTYRVRLMNGWARSRITGFANH
jgi:hypothetical protein